MWTLFLDDVRKPSQVLATGGDFFLVAAKSYEEAVKLIEEKGAPKHIYFDHDLSEEHYTLDWADHAAWQNTRPTGMDLAKWIVYKDMREFGKFLPEDFTFSVHSMNPIGAENIRKCLDSYLEYKRGN